MHWLKHPNNQILGIVVAVKDHSLMFVRNKKGLKELLDSKQINNLDYIEALDMFKVKKKISEKS